MGAFVATTASDKGYELVKSLGADLIINYKKENFEEMLTGYDAVFDTLGGAVLEKSFRILKPGGQIVSISDVPKDAGQAFTYLEGGSAKGKVIIKIK
jgi:alcohol dehydrogenase